VSTSERGGRRLHAEDALETEFGSILPQNVPGTKEYFLNRFLDLTAMNRHLGPAHLFVTLTLNEGDPALRAYLGGKPAVRCPVQVTRFFMEKFGAIKELVFGARCVFGPVQDHWYRIEFQNRGAPHAHILIWLADGLPGDLEAVVQATMPRDPSELGQELRRLVQAYQLHQCRERCRRKDGKPGCSFSFPSEMAGKTHLKEGRTRYTYRREKDEDARVVPFNAALLLAWGAHLNVQFMTAGSVEEYLCAYVAKAEPSLTATLEEGSTRFTRFVSARFVSLCEVALHLLGYHPIQGTREVLFLNTDREERMWRLLRPTRDLERISAEGSRGVTSRLPPPSLPPLLLLAPSPTSDLLLGGPRPPCRIPVHVLLARQVLRAPRLPRGLHPSGVHRAVPGLWHQGRDPRQAGGGS
jgi:hypothetical protein